MIKVGNIFRFSVAFSTEISAKTETEISAETETENFRSLVAKVI
jgi:hypothetical protein